MTSALGEFAKLVAEIDDKLAVSARDGASSKELEEIFLQEELQKIVLFVAGTVD